MVLPPSRKEIESTWRNLASSDFIGFRTSKCSYRSGLCVCVGYGEVQVQFVSKFVKVVARWLVGCC